MSNDKVHYEVYAKTALMSLWHLGLATELRRHAIEEAEALLAERRAIGVRVIKETLDIETGEYRSLMVLAKGEQSTPKRRELSEDDKAPLCVEPADLYTGHARNRIGRLLDAWLRRRHVTPFELLHRAALLEELDASGMELQHAIQKVSIAETQARGGNTHDVIRRFQKLAERTLERTTRDNKRGAFPEVSAATLADVVRRLAGEPDGAYLLGGGVADALKSGKTWAAKLELILELADAAPDFGREFTFAVLAQPLSEILEWAGGMSDLTGPAEDLGASLAVLTRLVATDAVALLIRMDPRLEAQFPPLSPPIVRLAGWLSDPLFAEVRGALARRILAELNGPRRLRPNSAQGEIQILRALATVLTAFAGPVLPPEDVQESFTERSKSLVNSDFVKAFLIGCEGPMAETRALIRLAENVVGIANKRTASKWISAVLESLKFETELHAPGLSIAARLATLADLQHGLNRAGLDEADRSRIGGRIGQIGGELEAEAKFTASVARAPWPLTNRIMTLLQLASGQTAPTGPVAVRARSEVQKMVRAPELRVELAKSPALIEQIRQMLSAA